MLSAGRNCAFSCAFWLSRLWVELCFLVVQILGSVVLSGGRNCGLGCAFWWSKFLVQLCFLVVEIVS